MRLHVGCAMWSLPSWQGRFLPHRLAAHERLRHYASWCTAVEGNTTFYATPARATVEAWARQTEPAFRFVPKLPKIVTHDRRFVDVDAELRAFWDAIAPLGPRVDAVWIQLPAAFTPVDVPALGRFLAGLPAVHRYAVEVRHPAFFTDPRAADLLERALGAARAEWVPFDTTVFFASPPDSDAERDAWAKKPRVPARNRALTERPIVRYLGRDDVEATVAGWRGWVDAVVAWLREGRSPTMFVHTPDNADAPALARRFHDEVRARVPALDPLPAPIPAAPPTLF
ncbi:conserved hypothetical protein [Frankia canadensis]|uniref:DUF72 domain-containing protein n=1 Tax=Frankia canadensis TaxID=1836972 RepID=A0A2I2KW09_9ACTN|nr:DUF72 domain-containing protein [Frankia canadensis]SNQ49844.1 conserved hypothetical protein [Frankia canadensis]SOU57134.1 conserved hypothetical protein [Frankia canadensis]